MTGRGRVVLIIAVSLIAAACSAPPARVASTRVVATPEPTPTATPVPATPEPTPRAARVVAAPVAPAPPPPPPPPAPAARPLASLEGLGGWIDIYDHDDDPATVLPLVRGLADQGARTLYIESSNWRSPADIHYPRALGAALDEAKARGMRAVVWYPPAFDDLERDLRRSRSAMDFTSPKGNRFDAFGADIEYTEKVPDHAQRSAAAVEYSRRLREGAPEAVLAGIVIPPTSLEINPNRWPGFPWAELAPLFDAFMPMNYWTTRGKDSSTANDLTERNTVETKRLTGKPVHVIGGLAEYTDEAQVAAYVSAARRAGSIGGGLYDHATTRPEVWDELRAFNG